MIFRRIVSWHYLNLAISVERQRSQKPRGSQVICPNARRQKLPTNIRSASIPTDKEMIFKILGSQGVKNARGRRLVYPRLEVAILLRRVGTCARREKQHQ